uniref:AAA_12 domain-containing protein n=1 Tax=Heligmosomoides polygyrus TaxID=6339 RepID=A0A183F9P8_HELPZ
LRDTEVAVATVDSAQGSEKSIVIVYTTRTHIDKDANHSFFADPKRLNVALSRARDGMFVIGCLSSLNVIPLWERIITWCRFNGVLAEMCFFEKTIPAAIKYEVRGRTSRKGGDIRDEGEEESVWRVPF